MRSPALAFPRRRPRRLRPFSKSLTHHRFHAIGGGAGIEGSRGGRERGYVELGRVLFRYVCADRRVQGAVE